MNFKTLSVFSLLSLGLVGCASVQEQNSMAEYRANVISAGLPVQYGPLNVVSARSQENQVIINMIYNDLSAVVSPQELMTKSTRTLCNNPEVSTLLNKGVNYRVVIRSDRGQLLTDEVISSNSCENVDK